MTKPRLALTILVSVVILSAAIFAAFFAFRGKKDAVTADNPPGRVTVSSDSELEADAPKLPKITSHAGQFADGEPYAKYEADDFEVIFPEWQSVTGTPFSNESSQVFVSKNACNIIIRPVKLKEGLAYREFVENTIEEAEQYKPVFSKKEITDTTAFIDAEISYSSLTIRNVSSNYLTSKGVSYGVAFVSPKENFDRACGPYIDEMIKSVKVK
jgi:hypothetical protein